MRIWNKIILLFLILISICKGQNFSWPLDSPIVISGNYGELRPNHFHAGIDLSTGGKINKPVYATASGYVSRIKVSAIGYGKSIYITHPNGIVSVYAHLNSYNKLIAELVFKKQYELKSYEVDFNLTPNTINITNKEIVGFSGNTGNSTGPHLHFELRNEKTEVPANVLNYFKVIDTIKPKLNAIAIYNLADTTMPQALATLKIKTDKNNLLRLYKDTINLKYNILGIGFCGFDLMRDKGSINNIFAASVTLDNKLIYNHELNNISFADQRYVNEFSEVIEKQKYQRCFLPTLFPKEMYTSYFRKGRIILTDTLVHEITLTVSDEVYNQSVLKFWVKAKKLSPYLPPKIKSNDFVDCTKDFLILKNKLQIFIPANTLYKSTNLIFENTIERSGKLIILPSEANLKSTSIVGFEVPKKYLSVKNKLILNSGSNTFTPINVNDSIFYSVKNFGWFQLNVDTIKPKIKLLYRITKTQTQKNINSIDFKITDDESGIGKYNLYINDKWVLTEYDAKNDLLTYTIDGETPVGNVKFKLEIEDKVKNVNTLNFELNLK
jgi:hypothetical protein